MTHPIDAALDEIEILDQAGCGGYDWSEMRLVRHTPTGRLGYGEASGCSCSSFEDYFASFEDYELLTAETWSEFQAAVEAFDPENGYSDAVERQALLRAANEALSA